MASRYNNVTDVARLILVIALSLDINHYAVAATSQQLMPAVFVA